MTGLPAHPVPALRACIASAGIGHTQVLHDLDLQLQAGRWTAIVGPNGAGKSTLLRVLAGLLPCSGRVWLHEQELARWKARARARQLAWMGQGDPGSGDLLAWDVAMLGRLPHRPWLAAADAADARAVEQALRATRAWDLRERRLNRLSGGERQRVLLARLLATQAPVWLMDEPLAHLDPPHQGDWLQIVRDHVAGGGTVVSVLHELNLALQADQLLVLRAGRLQHAGPPDDPTTRAALQASFDDRIEILALGDRWIAVPVPTARIVDAR